MHEIANENATVDESYFDWHPKPPFWKDYVKWFDTDDSLLDIGCGEGWFADHFDDYVGIDSSMEVVARAKSLGRNVIHGFAEDRLPFDDNSFDAVLLKDVLEHLQHPAETVKESARVLKPGGKLVAFSPDAQRWMWDDYTHVRPFTRNSFRKLFEDQGLLVERVTYEPLMRPTWLISEKLGTGKRLWFFWPLAWIPFFRRNVLAIATKSN